MKFFIVNYINFKEEGSIQIKGYHDSMSDAQNNLKNYALEFIRQDGGERQEKLALSAFNKSLDEIRLDNSLGNGYYIGEVNKKIYVYEKSIRNIGYIFSNMVSFIEKVGSFIITELDTSKKNISDNNLLTNKTTTHTSNIIVPKNTQTAIPYRDELMKFVNGISGFHLKPVQKRKAKQNLSINSLVENII